MKSALATGLLSIFSLIGFAQEAGTGAAPLSKGQNQLNFGLSGFGGSLPVYVGVDFAVHNDVTVGPVAALDIFDDRGFLRVGAKGDYHWNRLMGIPSNWDFYTGLNAGWRVDTYGENDSYLDIGGQIGGRWYWSDRWGLNVELGFSGAVAGGLGVSYKF